MNVWNVRALGLYRVEWGARNLQALRLCRVFVLECVEYSCANNLTLNVTCGNWVDVSAIDPSKFSYFME